VGLLEGIRRALKCLLLCGAGELRVPRLRVGDTVTIDGYSITLEKLTSDPSLAAGKLWFRSDLGLLSYSPDGSTVRRIPYGTINVDSHASRHEKGGADPIRVLGSVTVDSITSSLLSPGTDFIVAEPVDASSTNPLVSSPDIVLRAKYWADGVSAIVDAEIRHTILSALTSKLSFMFNGSEKAYIDSAGNLSVSGLQVLGTTVIDSSRVLRNIASVAQTILPSADSAYDLGSSSYRWRALYAVTVYGALVSLD
jgi:hypothetical protein